MRRFDGIFCNSDTFLYHIFSKKYVKMLENFRKFLVTYIRFVGLTIVFTNQSESSVQPTLEFRFSKFDTHNFTKHLTENEFLHGDKSDHFRKDWANFISPTLFDLVTALKTDTQ